jgi:hypothetical protein
VEANALREQGRTISAIARHLGCDRKTIRDYLEGRRTPGGRVRSAPDPFEPYVEYCRVRLSDDPHLWATTLFDDVSELGYPGAYPTFTRALRAPAAAPALRAVSGLGLPGPRDHRPSGRGGDPVRLAGAARPAGALGVGPAGASAGRRAQPLEPVAGGAGRERGPGAPGRGPRWCGPAAGGCTKRWRFDRMATVCHPDSGRIAASFAQVAKHYGVAVDVCPSRHGNRKGVVEKGNHSFAPRHCGRCPPRGGRQWCPFALLQTSMEARGRGGWFAPPPSPPKAT